MTDRPVPKCGSLSARLATLNAVRPSMLLPWYLGEIGRGRTGTPGVEDDPERTAEFFRRKCRSRSRQLCRQLGVSRAAMQSALPGVFEVPRRCLVLRPARRGLLAR
jgi:hypothetical protein